MKINLKRNRINNFIFLIGIIILIAALFLPLWTTCESSEEHEFITVFRYGYQSPLYYASLMGLTFIVLMVLLADDSMGMIAVLTVAPLLFIITVLAEWISPAGFGRPCGNSSTNYQYLLYLGQTLIVSSSFLRIVFRK